MEASLQLSEKYLETRTQAKSLFKQGKVQDSFSHIEGTLIKNAKQAVEEGNVQANFELMNALILNARLRQEIGEFPIGDKALQEVRDIIEKNEEELGKISAERVFYYKAKGIHVQAKNYARQLYHQRSNELFNQGLVFLKSDTSFPNIRIKFTCKLLEGLGHLMCEPLMFDICDKHLNEAEALYDNNIDAIFSKHDSIRFQIKKSSFLKKYGFFIEALELLGDIQKELMELLKAPKSTKDSLASKKLLFKTHRDQARLHALMRQEQKAHDAHKKAERILKEEIIPAAAAIKKQSLNQSMRVDVSVKSAKLQLLKGLWISKFGFEKSIDELVEAYHMFNDAVGDEKNYFGANCQLEVGSNYIRQKEIATCSAFLNQAVEIFEHLFGEEHPIIQKYYAYSADLYSYADDNDSMLSMAHKNLEIVEKFNKPSDPSAPESLFILDAILQLISMLQQADRQGLRKEEIATNIARMETICGENGIIDGCQLLHSAYTMKSMGLIREEKIREALSILEDTYEKQVKKLRNNKQHPFLEQCVSQLGLLQKVTQQTEAAEQSYMSLTKIKEIYYGELSESLVITLKNLGAVQTQLNKVDEADKGLRRALSITKRLLEANKIKDKSTFKQHITEIIFLQLSLGDNTNPTAFDDEHYAMCEDILKQVHGGEKGAQFGYFLFLKAKKMMMSPNTIPEETLSCITRAIEIQEDLEKAAPKPSAQIGRYHYFRGTVEQGLDRPSEALQSFKKAKDTLENYPDFAELIKELEYHVNRLETQLGVSGTVEQEKEGQVEANEDNTGTLLAIASVGIVAVGAIVYAINKVRKN